MIDFIVITFMIAVLLTILLGATALPFYLFIRYGSPWWLSLYILLVSAGLAIPVYEEMQREKHAITIPTVPYVPPTATTP